MNGLPDWIAGVAALAALAASHVARGDELPIADLLARHGCTLCHAEREQMAGPSWAEIGSKYRGNPRASAMITSVVRAGKHGGGPWPMPPLPEVGDAEAKRIARYILAIKP